MSVSHVPPEDSEILSHTEARQFLRVSKSTLDRIVKKKPELKIKLPGGRRALFRRADLRRLLDEGRIKGQNQEKGGSQ
jgi:hypothetical protein